MKPIKVIIQGALGRMGREVVNALCHESGIKIVGLLTSVCRALRTAFIIARRSAWSVSSGKVGAPHA